MCLDFVAHKLSFQSRMPKGQPLWTELQLEQFATKKKPSVYHPGIPPRMVPHGCHRFSDLVSGRVTDTTRGRDSNLTGNENLQAHFFFFFF